MIEQQPYELVKGESLIHNKYKVLGKLGTTFGSSVHAISMFKGENQIIRAVKVESTKTKEPQINTEIIVLKQIKECNPDEVGFPKIYQYGHESEYNYIVLSLLGPNLEQLLKLCGGSFSLKTTMIVALQILDRLEVLHTYGFIYGDLAPDNFLVGLGPESVFIFMIDFGKCKRFKNRATGQHIIYNLNPIFASINAHNKIQASRRDDIQSLLYMLVYLHKGKLPWNKPNDIKRGKNEINVDAMKKRVTPEMLCHKMPLQIIDLVYYIKSVEFYEKPDYEYIRKLFYRCLDQESMDFNIVYDWNKLEEVDFKVYSGQPKIILKQKMDKLVPPTMNPRNSNAVVFKSTNSDNSGGEDEQESSRLNIN